ncbi:MAG: hypothetical protein OEZ36_07790 [Spirochaetota bacterium]|nr:hypothetical protein [Spirochaetota bacterium]
MKKIMSLLLISAFALSIAYTANAYSKKTYVYAFQLEAHHVLKHMPKANLHPKKVFVLIWSSPWPIGTYEKNRILNNFSDMSHINKGYSIRQIDKELITSGKFKLGLIKVVGGSKSDVSSLSGQVN